MVALRRPLPQVQPASSSHPAEGEAAPGLTLSRALPSPLASQPAAVGRPKAAAGTAGTWAPRPRCAPSLSPVPEGPRLCPGGALSRSILPRRLISPRCYYYDLASGPAAAPRALLRSPGPWRTPPPRGPGGPPPGAGEEGASLSGSRDDEAPTTTQQQGGPPAAGSPEQRGRGMGQAPGPAPSQVSP